MTLVRVREGPPPQVPARRTLIGAKSGALASVASPVLASTGRPDRQGRLGPRRFGSGARRAAPFARPPFTGNPFAGSPFPGKPFPGEPVMGLPSSTAPGAGIPSGSVAFGTASSEAAAA
jgi:hypothetical protein